MLFLNSYSFAKLFQNTHNSFIPCKANLDMSLIKIILSAKKNAFILVVLKLGLVSMII